MGFEDFSLTKTEKTLLQQGWGYAYDAADACLALWASSQAWSTSSPSIPSVCHPCHRWKTSENRRHSSNNFDCCNCSSSTWFLLLASGRLTYGRLYPESLKKVERSFRKKYKTAVLQQSMFLLRQAAEPSGLCCLSCRLNNPIVAQRDTKLLRRVFLVFVR